MGVWQGFLTLLVPLVFGALPPSSPALPGLGPLPNAPPPLIPIDHQRCVALKKETNLVKVPVPYFCHPQDMTGIPVPSVINPKITLMVMRLQWSGYRMCTRQMSLPTHRYVPVPVCCPGWRKSPSGKCDTPTRVPPPSQRGPCLNGGFPRKGKHCCICPTGFSGAFCQNRSPAAPRSTLASISRGPIVRPPMMRLPGAALPLNRPDTHLGRLIRKLARLSPSGRGPLPINPTLVRLLMARKQGRRQSIDTPTPMNNPKGLSPRPTVNTAYINQVPRAPASPPKPVVNTAYINKVPQNPNPAARPTVNTAYINQLPKRGNVPNITPNVAYINQLPKRNNVPKLTPNVAYINQLPKRGNVPKITPNVAYINQLPQRQRPVVKPPLNIAYINQLVPPRPTRITVNTAYINRLPRPDGRNVTPTTNTAAINQLPKVYRLPVQAPAQTAYINRVPSIPLMRGGPLVNTAAINRIPPNTPRPVIAPPVVMPTRLGIRPMVNPAAVNQLPPRTQEPDIEEPTVSPMMPKSNPVGAAPARVGTPEGSSHNQPSMGDQPSMDAAQKCKQIIEVGVTRCFREAGVLAAPADVFNPQNPEVARVICSQGRRLRPCIMAGETACGRGMRVIITRRMLSSLLNAMGNLCALQVSRPPTRQSLPNQPQQPRIPSVLPPQLMPQIPTEPQTIDDIPQLPQVPGLVEGEEPIRRSCMNGGYVVVQGGVEVCECPDGFGGDHCEIPICIAGCENNGVCENVDGAAMCVCSNGYTGDMCEIVPLVAVTEVEQPKPVDPATTSLETSPNPVPEMKKTDFTLEDHDHSASKAHPTLDVEHTKVEIFGYPLWFILAIALGIFVLLFVLSLTCCLCLKCRRSKQSFELSREAVKIPLPDNIYTVGIVPPVYEAKGIPPLSYEEAKGETIKGDTNKVNEPEEVKEEEN
ncbi:proline-rich protein 36-like isoform X2 [Haliotis rufescens]|uniref:proline-rich protein 36-like isoform X2 n=1 Tax=Haliotis rufescens TaxID=6454 RepID=UPI00201F8438|nr:proline-rich protein 36-like isoform X2 [Haliotis rufescens]